MRSEVWQPLSFADRMQVTPVRLLPAGTNEAERWLAKLPPDEISDAQHMGSTEARSRFIQCRIILRLLLGNLIGAGWYGLPFEYGSGGKPSLPAQTPVQFNIAHSGDFAVFALSYSGIHPIQIGVDTECLRSMPSSMELAQRFFHPEESAHLASLADDRRGPEFLRIWVRKEACLKATGTGIAGNLGSFSAIEPCGGVSLPASQTVWYQELTIAIPGIAAVASTRPLPLIIESLQPAGKWLGRLRDQGQDAGACSSSGSSSSHTVASCD